MSNVVVISIGMVTPLGLSSEQTTASVGAGLSSFEETTMLDKDRQPFIMSTLPTETLPQLNGALSKEVDVTHREARMLQLASVALEGASIPLKGNKPAMCVGLPEMNTTRPINSELWLQRLHKLFPNSFDLSISQSSASGRSDGLCAVNKGIELLQQGKVRFVFTGGVDTYFDPFILGQLDTEGRINSERNMDAFIPGEGACFLLLCTNETALAEGYEIFGTIKGCAVGTEPGHMYSQEPYLGEGLSDTLNLLFDTIAESPKSIETVFSSMNGENFFAKEWGVAFIRHQNRISHDYRMEHPADCIGDTGAASGPIMIGMALNRMNNKTIQGPVLVYASSDSAQRSACLLDLA